MDQTQLAQWFQENLAWVVGLPLGTLLSAGLEIIKLGKQKVQVLEEHKNTKDLLNTVTKEVSLTKEITNKTKDLSVTCENAIKDITNKFNKTDELIENMSKAFESVNNVLNQTCARITELEKIIGYIASNDSKLVASGKADKIVKLANRG